jgi:phosphopantetheinyl transferase (holo-ACP synthase)
MAVKLIENIDQGLLGLWEIAESTEQLLSLYQPKNAELANFLLFRNELRKREWLATRLLLQQLLGREPTISYDPSGKPHLTNYNGHISISHSSNYVAVSYHPEFQPGIDIELITRNIERAARRFLSPKELNDCTVNGRLSNKDLMLRWCAKEAVFKMVPNTDVDFASQITCEAPPIIANEGILKAIFSSTGKTITLPLQFRLFGYHLMVWGNLKI